MIHFIGDKYRCWRFKRLTEADTKTSIAYQCKDCDKIFLCTKPLAEMRVGWTGEHFGGLTVDDIPLVGRE